MPTQIGELKDRVTLLAPTYGDEKTGQEQVKYASKFDAWAKVEGGTARDVTRFRQAGVEIEGQITIRIAVRIQDDWQVQVLNSISGLKAGVYRIKSIAHVDRRWTVLGVARGEP